MAAISLPETAELESSGLLLWRRLQRKVLRRLVAPQRTGDDDNALFLLSLSSQIKLVDSDNGFSSVEEQMPVL